MMLSYMHGHEKYLIVSLSLCKCKLTSPQILAAGKDTRQFNLLIVGLQTVYV